MRKSRKVEDRMKQSKISCFTEEEIGVAGILLDLGNSVVGSESRHYLLWGSKRRRSTRDAPAPAPVSESPSINGTEIEIEPRVIVEVPSTSPTTPLSFSPSESDEKSKHSSKKKVFLISIFFSTTIFCMDLFWVSIFLEF